MPVKRRRNRARREAWTEEHFNALKSGMRYLGAFGSHRDPWPMGEVAEAWATLREPVMAAVRAEKPCRRPWAFWTLELKREMPFRASEQRRFLYENGHLDAEERAMIAADPSLLEPREPWYRDR